ncbi:MAG: polyprenyl synthetase family protein [Desulfobacterales bacterium]|nr:polyprenyl synthetase family protein [Desulfobacterales bacterium]
MEQFIDLIREDMQRVEEEFQMRLTSQVPRLTEVAQDLLNRGGKRFRPALLLISARLCNYKGSDHIPLAAVIEFIHTATLLHDDVIDNAEVRRGSPSANRQVGNRYSVLTGDFLFCKSLAIGIAIGNLRILQTLIAATTALSEGEAMEMEQAGEVGGMKNLSITEEENLGLIINKTAVLISAAMRIGAILGQAPSPREEALASFGLAVGIAFQLVDDCLDYIGNQEVLRKEIGIDLKEGKITVPLIHTLTHCTPKEKKGIEEVILSDEFPPDGLQRVIALIDKYKGFDYTFAKAQQCIDEGKAQLQILPPSREKEALFAGADYVVRRKV